MDDILVAKLRPGQCIDLEAHATKGTGGEHAKWSPVATAWYRLQPEVVLTKQVKGKDAEQLAETCPGLFTLQEVQFWPTYHRCISFFQSSELCYEVEGSFVEQPVNVGHDAEILHQCETTV